jgi:hypothetical protein
VNQPPVAVQFIKRAVRVGQRADRISSLDLLTSYLAVVQSTTDSADVIRVQVTRPFTLRT